MTQSDFKAELVLIASSTGGPPALERVLSSLNRAFPVPILIVQHTLSHFTQSLAKALDNKTALTVKTAEEGETIKAGAVYLAPGGVHMRINAAKQVYFDTSPPRNGVRPAADALFESVAESLPKAGVLAVILTGMGSDGEIGLRKIKAGRNCFCITQSEKTCVVYGMPHAVTESGLSDMAVDLNDIANVMESFRFA